MKASRLKRDSPTATLTSREEEGLGQEGRGGVDRVGVVEAASHDVQMPRGKPMIINIHTV